MGPWCALFTALNLVFANTSHSDGNVALYRALCNGAADAWTEARVECHYVAVYATGEATRQ